MESMTSTISSLKLVDALKDNRNVSNESTYSILTRNLQEEMHHNGKHEKMKRAQMWSKDKLNNQLKLLDLLHQCPGKTDFNLTDSSLFEKKSTSSLYKSKGKCKSTQTNFDNNDRIVDFAMNVMTNSLDKYSTSQQEKCRQLSEKLELVKYEVGEIQNAVTDIKSKLAGFESVKLYQMNTQMLQEMDSLLKYISDKRVLVLNK